MRDEEGTPIDRRGSLIVTGLPGAGKSTVARRIAAAAAPAAHLDVDAVYDLVIGAVAFHPGSPTEDWALLALAREHIGVLARSFSVHGILPIVDDVIADRSVLDRYLRDLPRPIRLVHLQPSTDTVLARDARRDKRVAVKWLYLSAPMARALEGSGLSLDTTSLSEDETVATIISAWSRLSLTE